MTEIRFHISTIALLAAVAHAEGQTGSVSFGGTVRGGRDTARLRAVEMRLPELRLATFTDERGVFAFAAVPDGTWKLELRRVGFERLDTVVTVSRLPLQGVEFTLHRLPQLLDTLNVSSA